MVFDFGVSTSVISAQGWCLSTSGVMFGAVWSKVLAQTSEIASGSARVWCGELRLLGGVSEQFEK